MLSVAFDLARVAILLISMVAPAILNELDSLNGPTLRPFPKGGKDLVIIERAFKGPFGGVKAPVAL
jgi:hypothetical protein